MSYIHFDKTLMTNLEESLPKEILRSNRSGAYSCSTIVDCNTRKYHGLLVVPIPELGDENYVLLSSLDETVVQHGAEFNLGLHKYQGNNFSPNGHKYIREFNCDQVPTTIYRVGGVVLKKEKVFQHYENRIIIRYTLLDAHSETTLKLRPLPPYKFDLVAIFKEDEKGFALPNKILKAGIEPTSIEYMDNKALSMCSKFCKVSLPHVDEGCCYVIITVETFDEDELDKKMEKLSDLCDAMGAVDVIQADDRIWGCRRQFAEAARDIDIMFVAEDFVVPLEHIAEITSKIPGLEEKHGIYSVTSAHIGDGNIHVLPLNVDKLSPIEWMEKMEGFHKDLFDEVYALGGKMSGEHGIGYKKLHDFKRCTPPGEYKMICTIKKALDPNNILNPSKIINVDDQ